MCIEFFVSFSDAIRCQLHQSQWSNLNRGKRIAAVEWYNNFKSTTVCEILAGVQTTDSRIILFQIGDEIVSVNGKLFHQLTHDEAVNVLKSNHRLSFLLRYVGKGSCDGSGTSRKLNSGFWKCHGHMLN